MTEIINKNVDKVITYEPEIQIGDKKFVQLQ